MNKQNQIVNFEMSNGDYCILRNQTITDIIIDSDINQQYGNWKGKQVTAFVDSNQWYNCNLE